jgi:hypothetical protein
MKYVFVVFFCFVCSSYIQTREKKKTELVSSAIYLYQHVVVSKRFLHGDSPCGGQNPVG